MRPTSAPDRSRACRLPSSPQSSRPSRKAMVRLGDVAQEVEREAEPDLGHGHREDRQRW